MFEVNNNNNNNLAMPVSSDYEAAANAFEVAGFILMKHNELKKTTDKKVKLMKSLNAFIAFRSRSSNISKKSKANKTLAYYQGMFSKFQQRERSGYLTFLWKRDPCQNKWYILAKAYSVIRDVQGKANSPLQLFLHINDSFISVAEPDHYLSELKYNLDTVFAADGTMLEHRLYATNGPIDEKLKFTNLSVQDVIANSVKSGYVKTQALMPITEQPLMVMMAMTSPENSNTIMSNEQLQSGANNSIQITATPSAGQTSAEPDLQGGAVYQMNANASPPSQVEQPNTSLGGNMMTTAQNSATLDETANTNAVNDEIVMAEPFDPGMELL